MIDPTKRKEAPAKNQTLSAAKAEPAKANQSIAAKVDTKVKMITLKPANATNEAAHAQVKKVDVKKN